MPILLKRTKTFDQLDHGGWIEAGGGFVYCNVVCIIAEPTD